MKKTLAAIIAGCIGVSCSNSTTPPAPSPHYGATSMVDSVQHTIISTPVTPQIPPFMSYAMHGDGVIMVDKSRDRLFYGSGGVSEVYRVPSNESVFIGDISASSTPGNPMVMLLYDRQHHTKTIAVSDGRSIIQEYKVTPNDAVTLIYNTDTTAFMQVTTDTGTQYHTLSIGNTIDQPTLTPIDKLPDTIALYDSSNKHKTLDGLLTNNNINMNHPNMSGLVVVEQASDPNTRYKLVGLGNDGRLYNITYTMFDEASP